MVTTTSVEESVEMNDVGNGTSAEEKTISIPADSRQHTRSVPFSRCRHTLEVRPEVQRHFLPRHITDFGTYPSIDSTDAPEREPPSQVSNETDRNRQKKFKIRIFDRLDSFAFATSDRKRELLYLARRFDSDGDEMLDETEYESMKEHLKVHHKDLYKLVCNLPERYTEFPFFVILTALLLGAVSIFHKFHYHKHHGRELTEFCADFFYPNCSRLVYHVGREAEVWRFFTYAYTHKHLCHCLLNTGVLLIVGIPLEMVQGGARVAAVWLAGTIGGVTGFAFLDIRLDPKCHIESLSGASAAVAAFVGAHLASEILNWKENKIARVNTLPCLRSWCGLRPRKKLVYNLFCWFKIAVCGLYIVQQVVSASCKLSSKDGNTDDCSYSDKCQYWPLWSKRTSYTAHFWGLAYGFLVGFIFLENRLAEKWEKMAKVLFGVLTVGLSVAALTVIILDAKVHEHKGCSHDHKAPHYDIVLALIVSFVYLTVCFLLCFKGKRKMFCPPL